MAAALTSVGIHVDFVGSDDLSVPELLANPYGLLGRAALEQMKLAPV